MQYNLIKYMKKIQDKIDEARRFYSKDAPDAIKQSMKADYKERKIHNDIERNILYFSRQSMKINEYEKLMEEVIKVE